MAPDEPSREAAYQPWPEWLDRLLYVGLLFVGLFWLVWAVGLKSLVGTALDGVMGFLTLFAAIRFGAMAKREHSDG
jgi:hypothetical protein